MKTQKSATARLVLITVLFFFLGSIGYAAQTAAEKTTAKDVKDKTAQALQAISSYTADQRDEAVRKAKEALDDLDTRIDRMESQLDQKWDQMDQSARTQARETLTALQKQRTAVAEWYGGLEHSSRNAWEDVKAGFLKSYHELRDTLEKASGEF
jgi:small-conductance mechanosensitive channel